MTGKPEILALARFYPPTVADLEREYTVHKLWAAKDPDAYLKEVSGRVRGVGTTGLAGIRRQQMEARLIESASQEEALLELPVITADESVDNPSVYGFDF